MSIQAAAERRIPVLIAQEIQARPEQVQAAVKLLDEGATVPFVARYRKEVTGGLDDSQLRTLADRLGYLRELNERRGVILASITEQGKLTEDLEKAIAGAETKSALEDIYLPYKPKRRTRAMIARENGLEPLADAILADRAADPSALAQGYLTDAVPDTTAALNGARDIIGERLSENAALLGRLRDFLMQEAILTSKVIEGQEAAGAKYSDYFDQSEKWASIPSHRALAIFRGRNEGILQADIVVDPDAAPGQNRAELMVAAELGTATDAPGDQWLRKLAGFVWRVKLHISLSIDLLTELRRRAEEDAINVFARNLKDLLLAAPAGAKATLGLDPGIRTGVKCAVVDATGKVLDTATIYPFQPKNDVRGAQATLAELIARHRVELIAIGNGTASRETEKLVADLLSLIRATKKPTKVVVSEAGASVYSASELAAQEFPDLDVSLRGAVSIARRLQDPLAELVKIEPKSIGVGQYQHDVSQVQLSRSLDAVVEDCVNGVGVDLNTASAPLLARVSGLNQTIAQNIIEFRNQNGMFRNRKQLLKVTRLGDRTFEQAAGFLRIAGGENPLDRSSVHPEAYGVVEAIARKNNREVGDIIGDSSFLRGLNPQDYVTEQFGLPTIKDIISELEKPGRDPRPEFRFASFEEGVETLSDLKPGMVLEGSVTNVTNFGAFVDIGVHQDGLVHISALSHTFVKDPREVVKAGDIVKVKVMDVDIPRKRIALTMRMDDQPGEKNEGKPMAANRSGASRKGGNRNAGNGGSGQKSPQGAMAGALAQALASARKDS